MDTTRRLTLKSFVAASAATAILGIGAVPAAHASKVKLTTTTDTTTTDIIKDTRTDVGGRKVG